jgi:hypothetical protein
MAQHVRDLLAMVPTIWSVEEPMAPFTAAQGLRAYLNGRSMSSSDAGIISDAARELELIAAALMDQAAAAYRDRQPPQRPAQAPQLTTFPSACATPSFAAGAGGAFTRTGAHITVEESDGTTSLWARRPTFNVPTTTTSVDNFPAVGQDQFHNPLPDDPDPRTPVPRAAKRATPDEHCNLVRVLDGPPRARRRPEGQPVKLLCAICNGTPFNQRRGLAQDHHTSSCPLLSTVRREAANTHVQFDFSASDHLDAAMNSSHQAHQFQAYATSHVYRSPRRDMLSRYRRSLHVTATAHSMMSRALSTLESEANRRFTLDSFQLQGGPSTHFDRQPASDIHAGPCPCDDESCPCGAQHSQTEHNDGHDSSSSSPDNEQIDDDIDRASAAPVGDDIATSTTLAPQDPSDFSGVTVVVNPGMTHPSLLDMERAHGSPVSLEHYVGNLTPFTDTTILEFLECLSDISDGIVNQPISSSALELARTANPNLNALNLEQLTGNASEPGHTALGAPPGLSALGAPPGLSALGAHLPPGTGGQLPEIPAPDNSVTYSSIGYSSLARLLESPTPSYPPASTSSGAGGNQFPVSIYDAAPIVIWEPFRPATPHPSSQRTHPCITCKRRYVTAYATQVYDVFEDACTQAASCHHSDRCGRIHDPELDYRDLNKEFEDLFQVFGYFGAYLIT